MFFIYFFYFTTYEREIPMFAQCLIQIIEQELSQGRFAQEAFPRREYFFNAKLQIPP